MLLLSTRRRLSERLGARYRLAMAALLIVGCNGDGQGRLDKDLGELVLSPVEAPPKIDVDQATKDSGALLASLALPHSWIRIQLGAHLVTGSSKIAVSEAETLLEELSDVLSLQCDGGTQYSLTFDNSKDYGRHAIFDGSELYLRPRFGKYHARAPQSETEAADISNEVYSGAAEYLALFAGQLELADQGAAKTSAGRAVRKIGLQRAAKPTPLPNQERKQSQWRDSIEVQQIEGSISLDQATGIAVAMQFSGNIHYQREGRTFSMNIEVQHSITEIGMARTIAAPKGDQVMRIPARPRELAERESLLHGIAPPARKAPTPKPVTTSGESH